ncbi:PIR protein [Plasmodium ovale]|uniref:PIR protein n=1 Tax=Plasmodium ovale TaxID=36330 RepID=A0A1D3JE87_PLAOA|nr:PIR protein [Plasmodium ovale]
MTFKQKTIYNVANLFDLYKNQLDGKSEDGFFFFVIDECTNFSSPYLDNGVSVQIFQGSIKYFSHLKKQVNSYYIDQGCRYFCYWLHDKILNNQKSVNNTINLYKQLLQKYKDYEETHVFQEYIKHFSNDMLANLIKLIELYEVLPKILSPIKRFNVAAIVSIPFVLTLVVSFVFFILYKIRSILKIKKCIYNDIDQETNELMYTSGKYNINSKNNEYSLSYQSV